MFTSQTLAIKSIDLERKSAFASGATPGVFYGRRKTLSDGYNYRIRFRFDAITTAVRPRYDYSTTYDKQSACSLYPASGVSKVFAARGRSNEMRHPLKKRRKNRGVGITPTVRFSAKDTLWLPEL